MKKISNSADKEKDQSISNSYVGKHKNMNPPLTHDNSNFAPIYGIPTKGDNHNLQIMM